MIRRALALVACALVATSCVGPASTTDPAPAPPADTTAGTDPPPPNDRRPALVDFVQDGDAAIVIVDGEEARVRLIGINTPEREECYGTESRELLKTLIEGREVDLVTDVDGTDRFGRILAYVYDGATLINAEMVRRGAAIARPFEPNTTLQDFLEAAEAAAQSAAVGMWAPTACGGEVDPDVQIAFIKANAPGRDDENLNGEYVVVTNTGAAPAEIGGWGIKDESSVHRYTFPTGVTLPPGDEVTVYTGCGTDEMPDFYWCANTPVWDNAGDTAFLSDTDDRVRHRLSY